jgi:hypothetical protein
LGLEPVEARPGGLRYRCGSTCFALFESTGAASGTHTQMAWEVDHIEATTVALRSRGVVFEEYDVPGLKTVNGVAEVEGNYPSKGTGKGEPGSETARATCSVSASHCADDLAMAAVLTAFHRFERARSGAARGASLASTLLILLLLRARATTCSVDRTR